MVGYSSSVQGARPAATLADRCRRAFAEIIGASLSRIDGPLKDDRGRSVCSDYHFPRMVYAVPVCSTIASGKVRTLDASTAAKMPGVLLVLHHGISLRSSALRQAGEERGPARDGLRLRMRRSTTGTVCRGRSRGDLPAGAGSGSSGARAVRRHQAERRHSSGRPDAGGRCS